MTPNELKRIRKDLGLTQKKMAEFIETPYRTYQDWELGTNKIPGVVAIALKCLKKENKKETA